MAIKYKNSAELIRLLPQIVTCLQQNIGNLRASKMLEIMIDGNHALYKAELAILILFFHKIVKPYLVKFENAVTITECKTMVNGTIAKLKRIIDADWSEHFNVLLTMQGENGSSRVPELMCYINDANELYQANIENDPTGDEHCRLSTVVRISAESMLEKLM